MKSTIILLSLVAITFAKIIPGPQNEEETVGIESAQNLNNYYSNMLNLLPSDREMLGLSMNRDFSGYPMDPMMSMQGQYSPIDFMNYPSMSGSMYPGMGMNYPNMMMPNFGSYPGYPGHYQGISKTDACGCSSSCGMPCLWWSCTPCIPCPICPEETTTVSTTPTTIQTLPTVTQELTTLPPSNNCPCVRLCPPCMPWFPCSPCSCPCNPDNNVPTTTTIATTTPTTTTTKLTTVTQEITETPPNNCIPCNPCLPCGPIWWMPCATCNCNNGCQTVPATTTVPTVGLIKLPQRDNNTNKNNCQCICAPCPPWSDCPPCPKNCPCY